MRVFLLLAVIYFYLFADARVFVYHRFGDDRYPSTNISVEELRQHFDYLKTNNYVVVKLEDIIQKLKQKETIPDNWVAFTIDDSYKSFLQNGLPIFKEYNYPFTLFVYIQATKDKYSDFMNWDELIEVQKYGSLGLHSFGHGHLTHMSKEQIQKDTQQAYELFEQKFNKKPKFYAHPFGEYDENVIEALKSFNFEAILTQDYGSINAHSSLNHINRIALVGESNIEEKILYKSFEAKWLSPTVYPKDNILKRIEAKVNKKFDKINLYITDYGWREVNVNDGIISQNLNLELKSNRVRIVLSPDYYTVSNKLIIKSNKENTNNAK